MIMVPADQDINGAVWEKTTFENSNDFLCDTDSTRLMVSRWDRQKGEKSRLTKMYFRDKPDKTF